MNIQLITSLLIILAALGSAIWNLHVKQAKDSIVFVTLMVIPQFLIAAPIAIMQPITSLNSLYYLLGSSIVHTCYIIFLVNAYRHGMLSRIYPIAIGSATLISLFWHILWGQKLSYYEYFGVILISFVIMNFTFIGKHFEQVISGKSIIYALCTSLFIFAYTTIDTYGIRNCENPIAYISWLFSLKALILFLPMLFLKKINWKLIKTKKNYIIAGLLAGFGYAVAAYAFIHTPTSVVLALRSTSILFVYLLSIFILNEKKSIIGFILTFAASTGVFLVLL